MLPALAAGATVAAATFGTVMASDQVIHPPTQPWDHGGMLDAFDAARLARGEVAPCALPARGERLGPCPPS